MKFFVAIVVVVDVPTMMALNNECHSLHGTKMSIILQWKLVTDKFRRLSRLI